MPQRILLHAADGQRRDLVRAGLVTSTFHSMVSGPASFGDVLAHASRTPVVRSGPRRGQYQRIWMARRCRLAREAATSWAWQAALGEKFMGAYTCVYAGGAEYLCSVRPRTDAAVKLESPEYLGAKCCAGVRRGLLEEPYARRAELGHRPHSHWWLRHRKTAFALPGSALLAWPSAPSTAEWRR